MWSLSSRVHRLKHFSTSQLCYVKRDDELSAGISGTKLRKYSSIVPYLLEHQIEHLHIIAGPQSNNLLAALQVARELQLKITVFLLQPKTNEIKGNFKLSLLFLSEDEIIWVKRDDWRQVDELAHAHLKKLNTKGFILNEGASVPQALNGAMSLAADIQKNEQELGFTFQHIFIDAGTGFSATALIHGLATLKHQACVHVLLLADDEALFLAKMQQWIGYLPQNFKSFYPSTARSFGAVNQTIKQEIHRMAKEEGVLVDPIYSAKLFFEARKKIAAEPIHGTILIIHSGGLLTIPGFEL